MPAAIKNGSPQTGRVRGPRPEPSKRFALNSGAHAIVDADLGARACETAPTGCATGRWMPAATRRWFATLRPPRPAPRSGVDGLGAGGFAPRRTSAGWRGCDGGGRVSGRRVRRPSVARASSCRVLVGCRVRRPRSRGRCWARWRGYWYPWRWAHWTTPRITCILSVCNGLRGVRRSGPFGSASLTPVRYHRLHRLVRRCSGPSGSASLKPQGFREAVRNQ